MKVMVRALCGAAVLVLLVDGVEIGAQQPASPGPDDALPPVTFRIDVNLIQVPTIVTDGDGNFVHGLTADAFEVFEGGERQDVTTFALVDLPVRRPLTPIYATAPVESDVYATRPTFDGRVYVLMLDDLHTSAIRTQQVRQYATRFIEDSLGANDLAAVVYTSGRTAHGQELTGRRSLLLSAIDRFTGLKLPSATGERLGVHLRTQATEDMVRELRDDPLDNADRTFTRDREIDEPYDAERAFNARRALGAIENTADWMGRVKGRRKALVLFSEGIDYDIYAPFNHRGTGIVREARDAIGAAQRANVSIYAVDSRGLVQTTSDALDTRGLSRDPAVRAGDAIGYQNEVLMSQEGLLAMADETAGLAVVDTNDIVGSLGRIVRETSTYYLLGYATDPEQSPPGRFRSIEVRVDRPNVRVKARRGFVTPDSSQDDEELRRMVEGLGGGEALPALGVALNTPLPVGDLPFRVSAAPFMSTDPKAASVFLIIEVDGPAFRLEEKDGRFTGRLDASVVALDYGGEIVAADHPRFDLSLQPNTYETVRHHGLRLYSRLELPVDGRYQIRVGVHEMAGAMEGAIPFDVEVPDYARGDALVLSGLVLTSTRAALTPTPRPDPELAELFPAPPSATRVFQAEESVGMFAEVYSTSGSSRRRRVDVVTTVRNAGDGQTVFRLEDSLTVEPSDKTQAQGYTVEIPLRETRAGTYVLRTTAQTRGADDLVFREVPFEVIDD